MRRLAAGIMGSAFVLIFSLIPAVLCFAPRHQPLWLARSVTEAGDSHHGVQAGAFSMLGFWHCNG
ncbi:MAG: hypothetical protein ACREMY_10915, partial [bacterium]